jgi:hypothetical protein
VTRPSKAWKLLLFTPVVGGGSFLLVWIGVTLVTKNIAEANNVAGVVAAIAAVTALILQIGVLLWPGRATSRNHWTFPESVVLNLASAVEKNSQQEKERLRIHDPRPLPVKWHVAEEELFDHWINILKTPEDAEAAPVNLNGTVAVIRETYHAIQSKRLVILGKPGSGKTVLAHLLILGLLKDRQPADPVPVFFSLSSWDPNTTPLRNWIAEQLRRDYNIDGDTPDGDLASYLVRHRRILPVLDGFDEIAPGNYEKVVGEINAIEGPFVVTSRPSEYTAAASKVDVLTGAAGIKLEDLTLDQVDHYLTFSGSRARAAAWNPVFRQLREAPNNRASQHLMQVLTTPLMVMLARTIYCDTPGHDPGELLNDIQFPTYEAIEEHLLEVYVTAIYYGPRSTWSHRQTRRWLSYLASSSRKARTDDLTWWQLGSSPSRITRICTTAFVAIPAGWLIGLFAYRLGEIVQSAIADNDQPPQPLFRFDLASTEAWTGLASGVVAGIFSALKRLPTRKPERTRLRVWRRNRGAPRPINAIRRLAIDLMHGLTLGLVIGLTSVIAWGSKDGFGQHYLDDLVALISPALHSYQDTLSPFYNDVLVGCILGILIGLGYAAANLVVYFLGDSDDVAVAANPWDSLVADRSLALLRFALVGLGVGAVVGLATGTSAFAKYQYFDRAWEYAVDRGTNYGILYGSFAALTRLLSSTWGAWLIHAHMWLPLTRRLPWRPKRFLQDAHRRGVLRQAGAAYQFRHTRLQEHLSRG